MDTPTAAYTMQCLSHTPHIIQRFGARSNAGVRHTPPESVSACRHQVKEGDELRSSCALREVAELVRMVI